MYIHFVYQKGYSKYIIIATTYYQMSGTILPTIHLAFHLIYSIALNIDIIIISLL